MPRTGWSPSCTSVLLKRQFVLLAGPGITSRDGLESDCTQEAALGAQEGGREQRPESKRAVEVALGAADGGRW
jgi:hypothetical protein